MFPLGRLLGSLHFSLGLLFLAATGAEATSFPNTSREQSTTILAQEYVHPSTGCVWHQKGYLSCRGRRVKIDWGEIPDLYEVSRISVERRYQRFSGRKYWEGDAVVFFGVAKRSFHASPTDFKVRYYDSDGVEIRGELMFSAIRFSPVKLSRPQGFRQRAFFPLLSDMSNVSEVKIVCQLC